MIVKPAELKIGQVVYMQGYQEILAYRIGEVTVVTNSVGQQIKVTADGKGASRVLYPEDIYTTAEEAREQFIKMEKESHNERMKAIMAAEVRETYL